MHRAQPVTGKSYPLLTTNTHAAGGFGYNFRKLLLESRSGIQVLRGAPGTWALVTKSAGQHNDRAEVPVIWLRVWNTHQKVDILESGSSGIFDLH